MNWSPHVVFFTVSHIIVVTIKISFLIVHCRFCLLLFIVLGEFVGHEEFTLSLPYTTQVMAVDKCCYYTLSKGDINELISTHEDAAFELQVHLYLSDIRWILLPCDLLPIVCYYWYIIILLLIYLTYHWYIIISTLSLLLKYHQLIFLCYWSDTSL